MTRPDGSLEPTLADTTQSATDPTGTGGGQARPSGYTLGAVIGRGGMGEVMLAHDPRIGRDVALKRLRGEDASTEAVDRFLREAKIQARLDHPAIVPVHELGYDDQGRPYFTMKRLAGVTFAERLAQGGALQPLLRVVVDVCLAIELAHTRGVVHRDVKPQNVMLGDFGEVYVIDWGLARVLHDGTEEIQSGDLSSLDGTAAGAMLGTPGYMSPEQMRDAGTVDTATDTYAIGAMLFEVLAGEPLHPRGQAAIASTLGDIDGSPMRRAPDRPIPPELDALCVAALSEDREARPTAKAIADRIQRYLDGDRDVERRGVMAIELMTAAQTALAAGDRATAMRTAGRALALDPSSVAAAELVTALMLEPPKEPPEELRTAIRSAEAFDIRRHARIAAAAYLIVVAFVPIAIWNGVKSWPLILGLLAVSLVLSSSAWVIHRRGTSSLREMSIYALGNAMFLSLLSRVVGPFVLVPSVGCLIAMALMLYPVFIGKTWVPVSMILLGWMLPIVLEQVGMVAPTWEVVNGALVSMSNGVQLGGDATIALMIGSTLTPMVVAGVLAGSISKGRFQAQRQLVIQAWHLRQLLPASARSG
jgi:serine/threonine-protein kinase